MRTTHLYLLVGLFLGTVLAFGSFAQFVLVGLCGLAGVVAGQGVEGRLDLRGMLDRLRQ